MLRVKYMSQERVQAPPTNMLIHSYCGSIGGADKSPIILLWFSVFSAPTSFILV